MNLLPFEKITYVTKLSEEEIVIRLKNVIGLEKTFREEFFGSKSTKLYEGYVSKTQFEIKRKINYRNSFLPRITGIIQKDIKGSTIQVKMQLDILVIFFLFIWCCIVGLVFYVALTASSDKGGFKSEIFIPIGMLGFVYALTIGGFKFESDKSKKDLTTIFEGKIVAEAKNV